MDDIAIASDGAVYSVILAHDCEVQEIESVQFDAASLTSVNLLRCLLGPGPTFTLNAGQNADERSARLLIGDNAIRFRREQPGARVLDLGEAWKQLTNLPFVFALWLARPELEHASTVAAELRELRDRNLNDLDALITEECPGNMTFANFYFRECLRFHFGAREKESLRRFHSMCAEHSLINQSSLALDLI